jgi:Fungal Zn(2)-Cys(6) binuclear cluster domain
MLLPTEFPQFRPLPALTQESALHTRDDDHLLNPSTNSQNTRMDPSLRPTSTAIHKPTSNSTSSSSTAPTLNPRSCVTCRRRKVKCDKRNPCSNCTKANSPCVFPSPGRAPRRPRKPQDNELLKRLAKLEGLVEELSGNPEGDLERSRGDSHDSHEDEESEGDMEVDKDPLEGQGGRLFFDRKGKSRYVNHAFWANLHEEVRLDACAV